MVLCTMYTMFICMQSMDVCARVCMRVCASLLVAIDKCPGECAVYVLPDLDHSQCEIPFLFSCRSLFVGVRKRGWTLNALNSLARHTVFFTITSYW